jgi:hypothetical protein
LIDCRDLPLSASTCTAQEFASGCDLCSKGLRCNPNVHINVQVLDPHPRIDHELEYNVTFGARPIGSPYEPNCGPFYGAPGPVSCDLFRNYVPPNWVYDEGRSTQRINTNLALEPGGSCNASPSPRPEDHVWPFTVAPGIFQSPSGIYGNYSVSAGETATCPEQKPILTHGRPSNEIIADAEFVEDRGFRIEFLGDLILDCGHSPNPSEIHPPESILLHLGRPGDPHARYSLFGWHRFHWSLGNISVELWPNGVPTSADASLTATGVFYGDGGQIGSFTGPSGQWNCHPVPAASPNRLLCTLKPRSSSIVGVGPCASNPRMLPGCATDVAGGLIDVGWTP